MASLAREIEKLRIVNGHASFPEFVKHLHDRPGEAAAVPGFRKSTFEAIWRRVVA
nr:hypothetical protein [Candidatus Sigynarchaeum springense]